MKFQLKILDKSVESLQNSWIDVHIKEFKRLGVVEILRTIIPL